MHPLEAAKDSLYNQVDLHAIGDPRGTYWHIGTLKRHGPRPC